MDGITLEQAEFLVLLDAVKADELIGIDQARILPSSLDEHQALIRSGIEKLQQRGWLDIEDGIHVLNRDLLTMAMVMAYPELVVLSIRDTPDIGRQEFLHYLAGQFVVEFTMPTLHEYRLAGLPNLAAMLERVQFVLGMTNGIQNAPDIQFTLNQALFFTVRDLTNAGTPDKAAAALTEQGISDQAAQALLKAMQNPLLSGTVSFLRCQATEVVDARDLAWIKSSQGIWLFQQIVPGEPELRAETIAADALPQYLTQTLVDLADAART
jgi:hypothetical protein